MGEWHEVDGETPENVMLDTKIDDVDGIRNVRQLLRRDRLWYTKPIGGMYVYYPPTHWKHIDG